MNEPLIHFYDIESLSNVFTLANEIPEQNHIDVYYLVDDPQLTNDPDFTKKVTDRIHLRNKNFTGTVACYDLHFEESNRKLAREFGLSDAYMVNDPSSKSSFPAEFRLVCDTDPCYDCNVYPYMAGYNSYNYDTTELSEYFAVTWVVRHQGKPVEFAPTTAKHMREFNDELFSSRFKECMPSRLATTPKVNQSGYNEPNYQTTEWKIRKNMLLSGRHIDIARLNEKQSKVALKRLLGMLGYQILESSQLKQGQDTIETFEQLLELIAYNVSDIVNLHMLAQHPLYKGQFALKKGLLDTYPELVYSKDPEKYAPKISPETVRRDRLYIDSSSAQLATKALCPYNHLTDIPVVSFMYPSERKAKELNIPRVNVLEEAKKFFYSKFPQKELRDKFDSIYNYYKTIEGRNFNASDNYAEDYGCNPDDVNYHPAENLDDEPKINMNMFYYNKDGSPSNCFVNFSTGGIHGAEYNKKLYEHDMLKWSRFATKMLYVKSLYPDPIDCRKAKTITMPDGSIEKYTVFLKSGATLKKAEYRDIDAVKPELFENKKGNWVINKKYTYTSAALSNHEDFTSYYPNMLRMLSAFYNEELGYDRYAEIFDNKQKYGKLMKDKSLPESDRYQYSILREGTKLVLNSASGAGDANFESNIRMNNLIISMRIIGQLFTWRIGQAQTIEGAQIISTNTDGLYSVLDASINDPILARESADIGVEIEPEPLYLISKDSNNRIEMDDKIDKILGASGGTLTSRQGPTPTKALAHPAIIDWAMTEYLIVASINYKNTGLAKSFDDEIGRSILTKSVERISQEIDKTTNKPKGRHEVLRMFQNVLASSPASKTYIFATNDAEPGKPIIMQHYNRVFIMKDGTPDTVHLHAATAKKLTPAQINTRTRANERLQQHDPVASYVLNACGENVGSLPATHEAAVKKISGIEEDWSMQILNRSLFELSDEEIDTLLNNLDIEKYLGLLRQCFEDNWMNESPDDDIPNIPAAKAARPATHVTVIRGDINPLEIDVSDLSLIKTIPELTGTA